MQFSRHEHDQAVLQFLSSDELSALHTLLSENDTVDMSAIQTIVQALGASWKKELWTTAKNEEQETLEHKLIVSFHNNMNLLVQKTWVEKSDETLKEQVLYQIDQFCCRCTQPDYQRKYAVFTQIIKDAVFLLFGSQAREKDFSLYAMRIDPAFGLFWWFIEQVETGLEKKCRWTEEKYRIFLLLGMLFLSNY